MSNSKSSNYVPLDSAIEKALRDTATEFYNTQQHNLTLKRVRQAAERKLALEDGFLKADDRWNAKSKNIVTDQVQRLDNGEHTRSSGRTEPTKPVLEVHTADSAVKKGNKSGPARHGTKRSNDDTKLKPRKKRKVAELVSEEEKPTLNDAAEGNAGDDTEEEPPIKQKARREDNTRRSKIATGREEAKKVNTNADLNSDQESAGFAGRGQDENPPAVLERSELNEPEEVKMSPETTRAPERTEHELSESELSSLVDEPPPPKQKRRKKSSSPKPSKSSKPKSKPTKPAKSVSAESSSDPHAEEIKRLQDWLVKCGIRKVWGKELALYTTPREKIAHLKDMLREAGMDGRCSIQKARQIKETRELAADLEAVKDFDKHWGKNEDEEHGKRPRGAAKLLIDFLDDGEESD
jgi:hypothetical protein